MSDVLISLATPGVLLMALGGKIATQSLLSLGVWSEELLRGDRLPILSNPMKHQGNDP